MKSQVVNEEYPHRPHCLINTSATVPLLQGPSLFFQKPFWVRDCNFSLQDISFWDISGTDIIKQKCQHAATLSCLTPGAEAQKLKDLAEILCLHSQQAPNQNYLKNCYFFLPYLISTTCTTSIIYSNKIKTYISGFFPLSPKYHQFRAASSHCLSHR